MKLPANLKIVMPVVVWLAFLIATPAHAAIDNSGLLDDVLARYSTAAASWASIIVDAASWLFWTLAVISMVWTFGQILIRQGGLSEIFAELIRFTVVTGFFWWLLTNGPNFASDIYDSLRELAGNATGLGMGLSPSGIVDIGFAIFDKVLDQSSFWSPGDSLAGILMGAVILVILALIGINMLLLLCAGWVLAYGGVFFLGFGGSRWTTDFAINYYKTVLGLGAQLMAMVLLVGIGKTFLDDYYTAMSEGISLKEMGVMLIVAVILLVLTNKVPAMLAGIITGASIGGSGVGAMGAGAAMGAAGMAMAAAATGGAAMSAGASNMAGGAQALMAAINKANENVSNGTDVMSSLSGAIGGGGSADSSEAGTGSSPFAEAAGFADSSSPSSIETGSNSSESSSSSETPSSDSQKSGGFMAGASKVGRVAADTGANLAKGIGSVAKAKSDNMKSKAMQRVGDTAGGKVAAAIKAQGQGSGSDSESPSFDNNSLSGGSGGWVNQTGGFDALSSEDQDKARQSHADWQASNPDKNTFDVGEYVSYAQERQQERNEEVASFVNKDQTA
ncbi:P-type conjugative transfer protein TrbL [Vibrio alginolyticus]|uniref:P-type conjugative transfer protein TrbL n=1 Tax=Vibrio alginolyticus TaxID=663 RepID=UPI0018698C10|nr:P-type conjugative transfer protein TrbL [Vibrio alginolyticus]MCG6307758.1 P-type conjugative transfer protein TrbL [Vibrio alginolyticus]